MKEFNAGSIESQIEILTKKINRLKNHFIFHKKDHHSKRGFLKFVSNRKKKLDYLKKKDFYQYISILKNLKIGKYKNN
ncbi:30S ribosomal protein S15 [Candidatus Riesia pediculicola]|uniref:30S ribosomal protein S15 n=1 Tax=Candidatus Riesia pediculicola TaxID=401619 RepID=UPI0009C2A5C8|nr:30S ribosomal protein S15 [Candidatus Riesia pediculicola]ARC54214.1 30S ribosomal protein S15 [Candidatus Riesia pediculicola]